MPASPLDTPAARWLERLWFQPVPIDPAWLGAVGPERALLMQIVGNGWERTQPFTRYLAPDADGALALHVLREDDATADAELMALAATLAGAAPGLCVRMLPEPDPLAPAAVTQGDIRERIREIAAGLAPCGIAAAEDFFSYIEVSHGWTLRWRLVDAAGRELARGGRHDGLVEAQGGKPTPGCSARLSPELLAAEPPAAGTVPVVAAAFDSGVAWETFALAHELRAAGLRAYFHHGAKNLRRSFKEADRVGAATIVVLGGHEWERGEVTLRDAATREETQVPRAEVVQRLAAREGVAGFHPRG